MGDFIRIFRIYREEVAILHGIDGIANGDGFSFVVDLVKELKLGEGDELPELAGVTMDDSVDIAPGGCTFIVL